ncbi:NAD-dependent epimerase/dehydratase family protein [Glycomyces sp. NPDC047369]
MTDLHAVLGATGAVGGAVADELRARGHRVRAVSRSGGGPDGLAADVTTPEGAAAACEGAAVVYQCAQPPYARWPEEFPGFTDAVLSAVEHSGSRLVMADNLYMYGPVKGPMTEDLPYAATNPKGVARAQVADAILAAHREGRVRATLGRASDYFGPRGLNTILGPTLFGAVAKGRTALWLGDRDVLHTVAYLPDVAAALVTLGERPEADGRAWHLPVLTAPTGREFLDMVRDAAGGRVRSTAMGRTMRRILSLVNEEAMELGETWYQRDRDWVVDDTAFRAAFGEPRLTPHEEAIAATLAWFRAQG